MSHVMRDMTCMTGSYEQEQEEVGSKSKRKLGARARGSWEQEQEEADVLERARAHLPNELHVAGDDFFDKRNVPFFERFRQDRVVGVVECLCGDVPRRVPGYALLVQLPCVM